MVEGVGLSAFILDIRAADLGKRYRCNSSNSILSKDITVFTFKTAFRSLHRKGSWYERQWGTPSNLQEESDEDQMR